MAKRKLNRDAGKRSKAELSGKVGRKHKESRLGLGRGVLAVGALNLLARETWMSGWDGVRGPA
eukprot:scaffold26934_cov19-Tisochrysis_lutea.AAC.1